MSPIQRALNRSMSRGSPEFLLDLFGQFLASLVTSEVCDPPHFRSKSVRKIHCENVKIGKNQIFDSKITSTYRMTFWSVSAVDIILLLNTFTRLPHLRKKFSEALKATKHLIFSFFQKFDANFENDAYCKALKKAKNKVF